MTPATSTASPPAAPAQVARRESERPGDDVIAARIAAARAHFEASTRDGLWPEETADRMAEGDATGGTRPGAYEPLPRGI